MQEFSDCQFKKKIIILIMVKYKTLFSHAHNDSTKTRTPNLSLKMDRKLYKPKTKLQQVYMRSFWKVQHFNLAVSIYFYSTYNECIINAYIY